MLRVLLVDDEPFITQGLSILIDWKALGYDIVSIKENGQAALEYLKEYEVDLIIADIKMPVMSGVELLREIRDCKISKAYFVIISGHSDFQYAQQALRYDCMEYLLKPVRQEELIDILKRIALMHEDSSLKMRESKQMEMAYLARNIISLLSGKYDSDNITYVQEHMNLSNELRYISIELDAIKLKESNDVFSEDDWRRCQRQIYQNCLEYLGEADGQHCIFDVSALEYGYDIGFIYCSYMSSKRGLMEQEFLNDLLRTVTQSLHMPVVMFVGNQVEDISQISESYRSATIVKSVQVFGKNQPIAYYETKIKQKQKSEVLCKYTLDRLIQSIEQKDEKKIEESIDELYGKMNALGLDVDLVDLNINYLLFHLISLAAEQDDHVNQEEILHYISKNAFNWGAMRGSKRNMKHFALEYAEYLTQLRRTVSSGVLSQIEKEIKQHYQENLTLKELSKKYYINSAYLGQIFQKKYGRTFKEYLNSYRMEQAVLLLLRTDKKVYEIAEAVGYHDLDYFINRFITAKGCTPTRFRKQCQEDLSGI